MKKKIIRSVCIITAREGSKSIKKKNLLKINGKPFIYYPIKAALNSKKIDLTFIDSDGDETLNLGKFYGCIKLKREKKFSKDNTPHLDVINNAAKKILNKYRDVEFITILLGNCVFINSKIIDNGIALLNKNSEATSVTTVWKAQDDHPYRALKINKAGYLNNFLNLKQKVSSDRHSYPDVYYYDQGPWIIRSKNLKKCDGPAPWYWLGKKSLPIIRDWVTGKDVHSYLDIEFSKFYLNKLNTKFKNI